MHPSVRVAELGLMDALFALVEHASSLSALARPLHPLEALIDTAGPVLRFRCAEVAGHRSGPVTARTPSPDAC